MTAGAEGQAECTLELSDADFFGMATGKLDPQKLYFSGKLKISGNIMASQKLTFLQKIVVVRVQTNTLKCLSWLKWKFVNC